MFPSDAAGPLPVLFIVSEIIPANEELEGSGQCGVFSLCVCSLMQVNVEKLFSAFCMNMNNREVQSARSILNSVSGKKATSTVVLHFTLQHL